VAEIFGDFTTAMERARVVMKLMEPGMEGLAKAPVREAHAPVGVASGLARRMLSRYEGERPLAADVREEAAGLAALALA
jgi:flagellar motor protein MotB